MGSTSPNWPGLWSGPPPAWPRTSPSWSTCPWRWPSSAWRRRHPIGWNAWVPAFADAVRDGFLALAAADPARWVVVDGTLDRPTLSAHILAIVHEPWANRPDREGERPDKWAAAVPAAPVRLPAVELFADVVGQEQAVAALRAAAARPVHAYLFRGAAGNGGLAAGHGLRRRRSCAPTVGAGPAGPAGPRWRAATPISTSSTAPAPC